MASRQDYQWIIHEAFGDRYTATFNSRHAAERHLAEHYSLDDAYLSPAIGIRFADGSESFEV